MKTYKIRDAFDQLDAAIMRRGLMLDDKGGRRTVCGGEFQLISYSYAGGVHFRHRLSRTIICLQGDWISLPIGSLFLFTKLRSSC